MRPRPASWSRLPHRDLDVTVALLAPPDAIAAGGAGVLVAPMHGAVTAVEVEVGDQVVAIEAMKMEHLLRADIAGTVTELASVGDQVATDAVLARIDPGEAADSEVHGPGPVTSLAVVHGPGDASRRATS